MSRHRAPSPANVRPEIIERSYALQWACQGLQQHARELRLEASRALEESHQVRAYVKLLLGHSRPLALALILGLPF